MTTVYFVRHAQPRYDWADDRTRPLTDEGIKDTDLVLETLKDKGIDVFYCSPYKRSLDTIKSTAEFYCMPITTDERFRERRCGKIKGNIKEMFEKRWTDHSFHEPGGESLDMVQKRNIEALEEILAKESGKNVVVGTHGTALSTIMHYYDSSFGLEDFMRIIDWMPYIIRLDFDGTKLVNKTEIAHIHKAFKG